MWVGWLVVWLALVFLHSGVTWKVSVVGVVHLLSWSEDLWDIESIELISGLLDVVLNSISILVLDSSLPEDHLGSVSLHDDDIIIISAISLGEWVDPLRLRVWGSSQNDVVILAEVNLGWTFGVYESDGGSRADKS